MAWSQQRCMWVWSLGWLLGALGLFTLAGLSLNLSGSGALLVLLFVAATLAGLRKRITVPLLRRAADFFELLALFLIVSTAGLILTYAAASVSGPYVDEMLAAADRRMGFDWLTLYRFMDAHRELMVVSKQVYFSIFATPILLALAFAWRGEKARYGRYLLAYGLALALTAALFILFPARSAVPYYIGLDPSYPAAVVNQHVVAIDAIKAGALTDVHLAEALGLVAFPSFHAAAAILFIWAAWPLRLLRAPVLLLNIGMILTTFVEGSHYLVDILGGILVALAGIGVVELRPRARALKAGAIGRPSRA